MYKLTIPLRKLVFLVVAGTGSAQTIDGVGRFEARLVGGFTYGDAITHPHPPNVGFELSYRFTRGFSALVDYQHVGMDYCDCARFSRRGRIIHEFILGAKFLIPNRSRITPHFMVGAGPVGHVYSLGSPSRTDDAVTAGAGIDVRLTSRFGLATEVRRVSPFLDVGQTFRGYNRTAAGAYFRF